MYNGDTKKKIENIIHGSLIDGCRDNCTTVRNFLCAGYSTSTTVKRNFESNALIKEEQERSLKEYATAQQLWVTQLPKNYLTRGGESQVYLDENLTHVVKVNDAVYYATWFEFFNSLVLHNLFFSDTAYELLGFTLKENKLCAVVRQLFIIADGQAELEDIREFLGFNGYENTRRQDYFNKEFGLILEDMHDENVIVKNEKLFFIDTVFYIDKQTAFSNK